MTCRFGDFTAVRQVSVQVQPGEIVGLIGANGAGKTTLIRLLLGLLQPAEGQVALLGEPPSRQTRRRIGYLPQGLGLYADLTAAQNMAFATAVFGRSAAANQPGPPARLSPARLSPARYQTAHRLTAGVPRAFQRTAQPPSAQDAGQPTAGQPTADQQGAGRQGAGRQGAGRQGAGRQGADRQGAGRQGAGRQGAGRQGADRLTAHYPTVQQLIGDLPAEDLPVGQLPLGLQRRVGFAVALAHEPEVLILDEPTSGVDPLGRARLWQTIAAAAAAGAGVLVSTHYMEEAGECDRLIVMAAGAVVASGTMAQIIGGAEVSVVQTADWGGAFSQLERAGLPVALAGRSLRVPGVSAAEVRRVLPAGCQVSRQPATLEERFFELALQAGQERVQA